MGWLTTTMPSPDVVCPSIRFPNGNWPLDTIIVDVHPDDVEFYESTAHFRDAHIWYNGRTILAYTGSDTPSSEDLLGVMTNIHSAENNQHIAVLFYGKLLLLDLWINSSDVITSVDLSEVHPDGSWEPVALDSQMAGKRIAGMRICIFDTPSEGEYDPELNRREILRGQLLETHECVRGLCDWNRSDIEQTG